jgi:hypothetical protein
VNIAVCQIGRNLQARSMSSISLLASMPGASEMANLAWACSRCNSHKGTNLTAIDPDGTGIVPLFNPRKDSWQEHFKLDGAHIRGLTAPGRATAWLLQMNAERRLELRFQLMAAGLW